MKATILSISILFSTFLKSQDFPLYRLYTFDDFVNTHFSDPETFYKSFYSNARYTPIARENNIESIVDVQMINHSDSSFEILTMNRKEKIFQGTIYETLLKTRSIWTGKDIPFIVNFCVEFELMHKNYKKPDSISTCNLTIKDDAVHERRDTSYIYNANQVAYKPQIIGYPVLSNRKNMKRYHPIESLEQLLKEAIKTCCHKSLDLRHLEPLKPHSQGNYVPVEDYIRVIFHSKGYISKVQLFGNLKDKIDSESLINQFKSIRFQPALSGNKPVHIALEYEIL